MKLLGLLTQLTSLPSITFLSPLQICPLEHFHILTSFFQSISSSKMSKLCMIWLWVPCPASSLAMISSGHTGFFQCFE